MKGPNAIRNTEERLQREFNERKNNKLEGMNRHLSALIVKQEKLNLEIEKLQSQIKVVREESFRSPIPDSDTRKKQSETSRK